MFRWLALSDRLGMGSRRGRGMTCTTGEMAVPFGKAGNTAGGQGVCLTSRERRDCAVLNTAHAKFKLLETSKYR